MVVLGPYLSWAVVGVAGAGAYWYYTNQHKNKRGRGGRAASVTEAPQVSRKRGGDKAKRKKENASGTSDQAISDVGDVTSTSIHSNGNGTIKQRKGGKKDTSTQVKSSAVEVPTGRPSSSVDKEEEIDNKEFAKQFSGVKTGTSLTGSTKDVQRVRTKKQSKANGFSTEQDLAADGVKAMSGNSSTTGADGDDDLSPVNSPPFRATNGSSAHAGVADMLEAPAPGPSVLRLTESNQPQRPSKPKQNKPVQEPESKKQRQNRAKNEARKAEREQAEKERRVLLEKQLRTAREAEGRPAKNGVPVSKPPAKNAWTSSSKETSGASSDQNAASNINEPLLDTFDENTKIETSSPPFSGTSANLQSTQIPKTSTPLLGDSNDTPKSKPDVTKKPHTNSTSHTSSWDHDLPSEEEQLRMLSELDSDSGWKEVKKRDKSASNGSKNVVSKSIADGSSFATTSSKKSTGSTSVSHHQPGDSAVRQAAPSKQTTHAANADTPSRQTKDSSGSSNPEDYYTTRGDGTKQKWALYDFPPGEDKFVSPNGYTFFKIDRGIPGQAYVPTEEELAANDPWNAKVSYGESDDEKEGAAEEKEEESGSQDTDQAGDGGKAADGEESDEDTSEEEDSDAEDSDSDDSTGDISDTEA